MDDNWVKIFSAPEFLKVELVKSFLEENEIDSYIMDRPDSAYVMLGEVQLFTPEKDAERAVTLIRGREF